MLSTVLSFRTRSCGFALYGTLVIFLWTIFLPTIAAQTPTVSIDRAPSVTILPSLNVSDPSVILDLPSDTQSLTFNVLSLGINTSIIPEIIVSTASPPTFAISHKALEDTGSGGSPDQGNLVNRNGDTWSLEWNLGYANWTSDGSETISCLVGFNVQANGSVNGLSNENGNVIIEVEVSASGPIRTVTSSFLFLGDTTSNAVLLFSPLLISDPRAQPTYPNYTLPPAQLPLAPPSARSPQGNLNLIIVPTASSPTGDGLDYSLAAIRRANASTGHIAASENMIIDALTQWVNIGDREGYRTMWVVGNLLADTNYTAWAVDDSGVLTRPMWFATKDSSFPCQLALPTDICPSVGYTTPLEANETTTTLPGSDIPVAMPLRSYPENITALLTSSLQSFSTSLKTTACGRDLYSHVSSCADCYAAYRNWLCRAVLPHCAGSASPNPSQDITPQTLTRNSSSPRDNGVPYTYDYDELLPCLNNCDAADRACPAFLVFRCPVRHITGRQSYAFIGEHSKDGGNGDPAVGPAPQSQWGWRWCNG
ncbi:stretch-activated Ca2+-permeable channel component-domain-containing protein [Kockovaella imperatae]|uniref:Stretch-activated Ca2+-permeable channel component-domain-containing protein n=1 Tax=Kockovaella imperatae TaxID=4999 RepID=A0A1Y1UQT2_9TREE|nr:stretch-activated Ca2+-permeable channel component-domain-containing protein [Kockovaella imperatae]ORX39834.1 stretch-activated Ca2+-permeable channel component-domain-containing protein [Kockovaella imperatae]